MSIIPYPSGREIVLRHKDSVVVYDPASKQLVVRNSSPEHELELKECPYCHRPLRDESPESPRNTRGTEPDDAASFASPEYFRMLHHSLPGSTDSSRPPSPRRRLTQPSSSSRGTPILTPKNAEFIGSSPASPPSPHGISSAAFSPNYFEKFFVEERELGRGGKGVVLLVRHVLDGVSLGHFACKRVPVGDDHEWLEKVLVEVQLLQHLVHQNLVSYRHVWLEDVKLSNFGPSVPCAFMLQQYCNAGDLHNYIFSSSQLGTTTEQLKNRMRRRSKNQPEPPLNIHGPRKLNFDEIYSFFRDITSGLNHLHINGYIHRDLKPSNCLLHNTGKELRVLVSDFGEVQMETTARRSTGATGTISYCAPEVLQRDDSGTFANFTTKSDVFSLGMILYCLCFAQLPYINADNLHEESEDLDLLRDEITSWRGLADHTNMRPDLPEKLYKFLRRLLSLDASARPTAEDVLHSIRTGSGLDEEYLVAKPLVADRAQIGNMTNSRILPVDTPISGTPVPHTPAQNGSGPRHSRPPVKLRLSSFQRGNSGSSTPPAQDEQLASPGGTLIVRSKRTSPLKSSGTAPPSNTAARQQWHLNSVTLRVFRVVGLVFKILSLTISCTPFAVRPSVAYPLIGLASLDLVVNDPSILWTVALLVGHIVAVAGIHQAGKLCVPKANEWA